MKHLALCLMMLHGGACDPDGKPCPQDPNCPAPVTCPDPTVCPVPVECPPAPPPCQDCPPPPVCPECPVCPEPPAPPVYEDQSHAASEFEITAILAAKNTLGLYVADPNGQLGYAVFPMPELRQNVDYEEILALGADGQEVTYDVGITDGKNGAFGLVVSSLCEREFAAICQATVTTNGPAMTKLTIQMNADPNVVFSWDAK